MGPDMYPEGFENKMDVDSRLDRLVAVTTKLIELTTQMAETNAKLRDEVAELSRRLDVVDRTHKPTIYPPAWRGL